MQKQISEAGQVFWETVRGKRFCFHTSEKKSLQTSTELLIQHMDIAPTDMVLDIFCQYGAAGIVAASLATQGHVHMVDPDLTAITFVQENANINFVKKRVEVYVSNGFSGVEKGRTFHKILLVVPEGMKKDMIGQIIAEAKAYLKQNGALYVVTIASLRHFVKDNLEKEYGNYKKIAAKNGFLLAIATKK